MSHNVEKMIFTGKKPWWYGNAYQGEAIGIDLGENAVTSEVAMKEAGLDWDVVLAEAAFRDRWTTNVDGAPIWREAEGERFILRDSDRSILGRCSSDYVPFQNAEAFEFLDGLVSDGQLLYHTAGSLEAGKRVWILAQTPTSFQVARRSGRTNTHHNFLLCVLGHDGKAGISLMPTDVRAECANTVGWADSKAEGQSLVFRVQHRGDVKGKLQLAAAALQRMEDETQARREVLQAMAQHTIDTDEQIDFVKAIFLGLDGEEGEISEVLDKAYETMTPRSKTILENKVAKVVGLARDGQGNEGDTLYDILQGFEEYLDHFDLDHVKDKIEKGRRAAKAVSSAWLGAGAQRKALVYKRLAERVKR